MREILFRGKRVDNGEWVYGNVVSFDEGKKAILPSRAKIFKEQGTTTICCNNCYDVYPKTVGQYTGLTDKNGAKIFERDTVTAHGYCGNIAMNTDYWEIHWNNNFNRGLYVWKNTIEVIGNIHDNPDILKNSENL